MSSDIVTVDVLLWGTCIGRLKWDRTRSPKAVVAYNPRTEEFRSGQVDLPEDFKHYIIKFKEDAMSPTTEIEMIYHEMAKDAGITMSPCFP